MQRRYTSALFVCPMCDVTTKYNTLSQLTTHLKQHSGSQVECPYEGCSKEFSVHNSLKAHISRMHKLSGLNIKRNYLQEIEEVSDFSCEREDDNLSNVEDNFVPEESVTFEVYKKNLALCLLKLQEVFTLPVSSIQTILTDFREIFSLSNDALRQSLCDLLKSNNIDQSLVTKLSGIIDNTMFEQAMEYLNSDFKRKTFITTNFPFVQPVTYSLGRNAKNEICKYEYVPILETLKVMLGKEDLLSQVLHPRDSREGILQDFEDGQIFKNNGLFQTSPNALQIDLYYDDFEIVNPLGAYKKKHKLGAFYFVLGNLYPEHRSISYAIQLVILCKSQYLKEFGFETILQPLLTDLMELEANGIVVNGIPGPLKGSLTFVSADNLGSHSLGGFLESFGPHVIRCCRTCLVTNTEMQTIFDPSAFQKRTEEIYQYHVSQIDMDPQAITSYGLKSNSPLNCLRYFHVTRGLPPDIMHDILEGVANYEVSCILNS